MSELQKNLQKIDPRIGYAHCHNPNTSNTSNTKYGEFLIGSPLSYQLAPIESNTMFISNILASDRAAYTEHGFSPLPLLIHSSNHDAYPQNWDLTPEEYSFLQTIMITPEQSYHIEQETNEQMQSKCKKWFEYRKNRITSTTSHSIYTRKKNFESLLENILQPKTK